MDSVLLLLENLVLAVHQLAERQLQNWNRQRFEYLSEVIGRFVKYYPYISGCLLCFLLLSVGPFLTFIGFMTLTSSCFFMGFCFLEIITLFVAICSLAPIMFGLLCISIWMTLIVACVHTIITFVKRKLSNDKILFYDSTFKSNDCQTNKSCKEEWTVDRDWESSNYAIETEVENLESVGHQSRQDNLELWPECENLELTLPAVGVTDENTELSGMEDILKEIPDVAADA